MDPDNEVPPEEGIRKMLSELNQISNGLNGPADDSRKAQIMSQIDSRKAECRALGLDSALNYLFWEIQYYPSRIRTCPASACPAIENPQEIGPQHIQFGNKGRMFSIEYEVQDNFVEEEDYMGSSRMTLFTPVNNKVLEVDGSGISSYVPGEWSQHFLEIHRAVTDFVRARNVREKELERATGLGKLKRDFGL